MSYKHGFEGLRRGLVMIVMAWTASAVAQEPAHLSEASSQSSQSDALGELREQVRELKAAVAGMRSDWQQARAETADLRRELEELRGLGMPRPAALKNAVVAIPEPVSTGLNDIENQPLQDQDSGSSSQTGQKDSEKKSERAASLDEEYQLLSGKVDDQYQTKIESASKYRVRLSGIVLMNLVSNQGVVDSIDLPTLAYARQAGYSGGSFGATLRQSEIGFEAFGPTVAGAKTRADLQLDLAGGFAPVPNGINSGLMRLRTATLRMDWSNTSVVVGQDQIFFSPTSPTSFAALAIPALSYAGNLWNWVPQIRVEHRIVLGEDSGLLFQGGILDPVSGEVAGSSYSRQAGPGEASRRPALGARIAWTRNVFGQTVQIGAGGFYSRQDYAFNRNIDGWAGMTDIAVPLNRQLSLSGKFYRGRAIGGLYGAFGQSVLFSGTPTDPTTQVEALNTIGGWAQLKYRPANKWEFNAAFGMENPFARDLRYFPYTVSYGNASLAKNQGSFVNMIYRPRSDLLFSAEYRHLTTSMLNAGNNSAGHLNLMMGVLF
jgi:hypothetical protein